ncbi:MAG: cytochrome P450 [Pseudomonadales bacterium]
MTAASANRFNGPFSPLDPAVMADPACAYRWLHEQAPCHHDRDFEPPFFTLSRYQDVADALRNITLFVSEHGQGPRFTPPAGMLSDPPMHTHYRKLVQQAFTPRAIAALQDDVDQLARRLLHELPTAESFDLHEHFAFPLPVIVISDMLGVPSADRALFKRWSDASVTAMGAEDPSPWLDELTALSDYLLEHIRSERRRLQSNNGQHNLTRGLISANIDGASLTDEEIRGVVSQLLVGGNETTTSLITNAVWRLLQTPQLWQALQADRSRIDVALEESLRFDPPVLGLYRTTSVDTNLHGVPVPANSKVLLHYAAANRDPAVFSDPDQFRLDRSSQRHLAFGLGVHFCLGAQLARLEARCALSALLDHFSELQLQGDGERIAPFFLWGRKRLPLSGSCNGSNIHSGRPTP